MWRASIHVNGTLIVGIGASQKEARGKLKEMLRLHQGRKERFEHHGEIMNLRRLEHDLYWGHRLLLMSIKHKAEGFRGKAKGAGFRAYCESENIPLRKAYRLIRRYTAVRAIMDRADKWNAELFLEVIPPLPTGFMEKLETACAAIRDKAGDMNATQ